MFWTTPCLRETGREGGRDRLRGNERKQKIPRLALGKLTRTATLRGGDDNNPGLRLTLVASQTPPFFSPNLLHNPATQHS